MITDPKVFMMMYPAGKMGSIFRAGTIVPGISLDMMCGYTYLTSGDQEYTQWHQSLIFVTNSASSSEMM
jgi:hypothetical protein